MDGFIDLFTEIITDSGIPERYVFRNKAVELPGFFRPTKERKPGGYRKPTNIQREESRIAKDDFGQWFQQIWNITGASTKRHPAPFPLELATRLVRMFSFTGDTVLDPFCGSGTTMIAALRTGRNSIGVEIDPEYCRMTARYLRAETTDLFSTAKLRLEKATGETPSQVKEDHALYEVRPARKKLE